MKIKKIRLHNFRSISELEFDLYDYSILIGPNNSGKSNILDAIRVFYDDLKFTIDDFPKYNVLDDESWIEITYVLSDDEYQNIKDEYKNNAKQLQLRKFLKSSKHVKSNQSNIYSINSGKMSENLFYGAKNISEAKVGKIIYIPEVTKLEDYTKLSGPSIFRDLLQFVIKKVVKNSEAFNGLDNAFDTFNNTFKTEISKDGVSLEKLKNDIDEEVKEWGVSFNLNVNRIEPDEMIKTLISYYLEDKNMLGQQFSAKNFGQGLQRHLVYSLIKVSTKYNEIKRITKKEFSPDFTFVLFEEPEAFLHPSQQEILNSNLSDLSKENELQILITTHSSNFVSKNIEEIHSLIKVNKEKAETKIFQISSTQLEEILKSNEELKIILNEPKTENDIELGELRYSLWFDPDRCCAFFADSVLLCEGLCEKALINKLLKEKNIVFNKKRVYVMNGNGKYDLHRYMSLFKGFGIKHAVLFDGDSNSEKHKKINDFINGKKNDFTTKAKQLDGAENFR
jgi:putative ATP-dependent endonuclease of the OLD family